MWRLEFTSITGTHCHVDILNGQNDSGAEIIDLVPSTQPFIVKHDNNDNIFTPIRISTGNIGVILSTIDEEGNVDDGLQTLHDICDADPLERPVKFYSGNQIMWQGFIKGEVPDTRLFAVGEEIYIPVISTLYMLKNIHMDLAANNDQMVTFGQLLHEAISKTGYKPTCYFNNTSLNYNEETHKSVLHATLNRYNYVTIRPINQYEIEGNNIWYDGASYFDILSDICTFCTMYVMEVGTAIYFITPDENIEAKYYYFSFDSLAVNGPCQGSATSEIEDLSEFNFVETDHRVSVAHGYGTIKSLQSLRKLDHIFTLSDIDEYINSHREIWGSNQSSFGISVIDNTSTFESSLPETPFITSNGPELPGGIVYNILSSDGAITGTFVEQEGTITSMGQYGENGQANTCIIFARAKNDITARPEVEIHPKIGVEPKNAPYVVLDIRYAYRNSVNEDWQDENLKSSCPFTILGVQAQTPDVTQGRAVFNLMNYHGEPFRIRLNSDSLETVYKISELEIKYKYHTSFTTIVPAYLKTELASKFFLNNGNSDTLELNSHLANRIEGISKFDDYIDGRYIGYHNIDFEARTYYEKPKSRLEVMLRINSFMRPNRSFTFNGIDYTILGMEFNPYESQLKVTLQEILA